MVRGGWSPTSRDGTMDAGRYENALDPAKTLATSPPSRWKLFLALSRTPHGLLDLATPALAGLLAAGGIPPLPVVSLGLLTAFAGYTAVYALNDLVDYRRDRAQLLEGGFRDQADYLDAVWVRHPLAHGLLSVREALTWTAGWAIAAFVGATLLHPICAGILLLGCALEAFYCWLQEVSHYRILVSGVVKTLGGVAAVFAVNASPSPPFLGFLFLWIFFWEIGGQNIPADWHDLSEDTRSSCCTLPVLFGARCAGTVALGSLGISVALSALLLATAPIPMPPLGYAVAMGAGVYFLLLPGARLFRSGARSRASALFNRASYYPLGMLVAVLLGWMASG